MKRHTLRSMICAVVTVAALGWVVSADGQAPGATRTRMTAAQHKAAAARAAALRAAVGSPTKASPRAMAPGALVSVQAPAQSRGTSGPTEPVTPDYFGFIPNFANSPLPQLSCSVTTAQLCATDAECPSGETCTRVIAGTGMHKFVDSLPGLGVGNANNLGQYIPVARAISPPPPGVPDDGDYYDLGLVEYYQQMHSDLPATQLRGYVDRNPASPDGNAPHYLGPLIIAQKDRPVRIKFTNLLPTGQAGNLFLPVDTTVMGAGKGPDGVSSYKENRGSLHLHGGNTPWISDGTPHQWTVPAGEQTPYKKGVSSQDVPDMPPSGDGAMTYYYPNQQSSRLMFYHDHVYGLTRLNVYSGQAAGYLVTDPVEDGLIDTGVLPGLGAGVYRYGVPLIVQDKTFVPDPDALARQDPTWRWGPHGNLWLPHVYMPNQNPFDDSGANAMGRWDYGAWFWPPYIGLIHGPVPNPYYDPIHAPWEPPEIPGTPDPTIVPEAFMDTPVVNGAAYPYMPVARQPYRFRVLNAGNDRFLNLQLYYVDPAHPTEVKMVPAFRYPGTPICSATVTTNCWPATWPTDNRDGGVPDPGTAGPAMIQIGTEGGLLPAPVVVPAQPINYVYNRRDITVLNVSEKALFLGPAERADIIIDFSQVPDGATLILYNDAPAPVPALDPRVDYYTGDPDQTDTGGAPSTLIGFGPNTRTVMQFRASGPASSPFNLAALQAAFASNDTRRGAFAASQDPILVAETAYNSTYNQTYANSFARIQYNSLTITPINPDGTTKPPVVMPMQPKAIQELFDPDYGRMNSTLGVEVPNTSATTQTTIPYGYIDPPTELLHDGDVQIWKVTHNGVDTHAVHFHLFNVQVINRVGWDGAVRPPDPNELGWKETVRMNPLEDAIVALRPLRQDLPWPLPDSWRTLDVTRPAGATGGFTNVDPNGNPITIVNELTNFGWEYVWHCHLLGHEENDMMRPIVFEVQPEAPTALAGAWAVGGAQVSWTDNCASETSFTLERALDSAFTSGKTTFSVPPVLPVTLYGETVTYTDTTAVAGTRYYYRVRTAKVQQALLPPQDNSITLTSSFVGPVQMAAAPNGAVTPSSLAFGNQPVNTTSSARTVTLSNRGTAPLVINSLSITGANAGDFAQTNNCGASLPAPVPPAPSTTCTINVTFRPTAFGARAAAVTIGTTDAVHPTLSVSLTGTGTRPVAGIAPASLSFPTQVVNTTSAAQTLTLSNSGNAPLQISSIAVTGAHATDFAQTNTCGSSLPAPVPPAPSRTCTVSVTFRPTASGARTAAVVVSSNDPDNPQLTVPLSGTGTVVRISPTALSFAPQLVGTSGTAQVVTLTNAGTSALAVGGITITGTNPGDFSLSHTCGTSVAAGRNCAITVRFTPTTTGARAAAVTISIADPSSPLTVPLSGTGTAPILSVAPASLAFNSPLNVTTAAQTITVSNTGTASLLINSVTLGGTHGNQFSVTNGCGSVVLTGMSCTVRVTFRPTSAAPLAKSATVTVSVAAPAASRSVSLSGTVVVPTFTVAPSSVAFGAQAIRTTSPPQAVVVTNTGTLPVSISGITITGTSATQFAQTSNCGTNLAVGANCTINVRFTPTTTGAKSGTLNVNVAAPATSQTVPLSGTGQ